MASALTLQGLQTVQNLTVRNNLAVQNQLQAKHLIADNVVQVNAAHRDYGQLVLGSASKITGSMNISSNTVIADGEASIDDVVLASGSTASIPIKSKAISPNVPSATNINATMFNPYNTEVNSFVGVSVDFPVWKTHSELDALEARVNSTFVATPLQRDMASLLDASIADQAIIGTNIDIDTLFAQYNIDHAQWVIDHDNWQIVYDSWSDSPNGDAPVEPVEPIAPADPRVSAIGLIEDYEAKHVLRLAYEAELATYNEAVAAKAQYDIDYQAWVAGGSQAGQEPAVVPAPGAAPTVVPAPVHPLAGTKLPFQIEVIDAAVRKIATVYSFSADGTLKLLEPLVIHSGGLHRVSIYPKGAFVMQGRTRENKFIFSQVADAQIDELIDETNNGHLGDNRRVAIEAGPVISYVKAGPDELDIVPQMVFQNASEKWRVALVPDRTTYEDEYGNTVQGDGLLKLMVQRHLAVPRSVTYNDSNGAPVTSNISWETVTSFVGNTGAVGVAPSSAPIGYKSS
jgi:hypothetical protein